LDGGCRRRELRRGRARRRVERLLAALVRDRLVRAHGAAYDGVVARVESGELDPYSAARELLRRGLEEVG
ncbi:MAG TPA: hypothetical protein VLW17_06145, partial [Thermoanaerobaculaceae bacterium]|nr:hypothetical protein [Thermoanaerobaculaceae bacterium]